MITSKQDRHLYIGGSEANLIYMNFDTKTFKEFWQGKLEGFVDESPPSIPMAVGTILEHSVINLYESINQVKGERDKQYIKGFARANTDYIIGHKVSDVKVTKKALEWHTKGKVPIQYKRQLIHYLYVTGLKNASIIAYLSDESLQENPFQELKEENLFEIPVIITEEEIQTHHEKIQYLEFCRDMNVYPI
jgi:predicted phage-related endonuclease